MFLRDQKKRTYILITLKKDKRIDLQALGNILQKGKLSFASDKDLNNMLNVQPGSVTPFAILNDEEKKIKLYFDRDIQPDSYILVLQCLLGF